MNPGSLPPRWIDRFLESLCKKGLLEEIQGDLHEIYGNWVNKFGKNKANRLYIWHVLKFLRPFAFREYSLSKIKTKPPVNMIKHNATIALRSLARHMTYSTINILGLTLGMTCFLFLSFWVLDERGIDNFHRNGKNLYNIYETISDNGTVTGSCNTPLQFIGNNYVLSGLKDAVPEIVNINFYATGYELPWGHPETFQVGDNLHKLKGSRAGEDFFKMFSYSVIAGNPSTALSDLSGIAISRKMAAMFFKSPEDAIGKSIRYENRLDFKVTAVFENVPHRSSLQFDFLINWKSLEAGRLELASHNVLTTVQLIDHADLKKVESEINRFYQVRANKNDPEKITLGLQKFSKSYLVSNFVNGKPHGGRIEYVNIFSGVAIFILVIACINFMSLATARSVKRAREVGVRKVVGSTRELLIGQFLGEAILMSFLALMLSVILLQVFLPLFNELTGKAISIPYSSYRYWLVLSALVIITGIIAGSYPALYLSSLKPVRILKGFVHLPGKDALFRKSLSVFQFSLSILLLIATFVVFRQMQFIENTHLGYDRENLLYVQIEGELSKERNYLEFKNEASRLPGIAMVDRSTETPHSMNFIVDTADGATETATGADAINWEGKSIDQHVGFEPASVGYDFVRLMKLKIVEGRDFSKDMATDSADAFLVNQEAVKEMGMKDPVGKWISAWKKRGHIIGVLQDYHTNSLHDRIMPVVLDVKEYEYFGVIIVRTEPGKTKEALAGLGKVYKEINPNYPFTYQFVDQEYNNLYKSETVVSRLSEIFAGLAIAISCLGLLGLAIFSAEQRVKEIGIRKVLGASIANLVALFSKDFLQLVGLSFLIALPFGWFIMSQWLQGYEYRIHLAWWIFALAGTTGMLVALLTISFQAVKLAVANPVKNLRSE